MKVLLLNGSPRPQGCTYTALAQCALVLESQGIETDILQIGPGPIRGCVACGGCTGKGECVFTKDIVNTIIEKGREADGLIIGSPVYYASPNGALLAVLDRIFYAGSKAFSFKPGACIVSARRAGTTCSLDVLTKYLTINQMPLVSSQYWCMVHGNTPEEVKQDQEGMQIMRTLGRNMAWLLQCIQAGKTAGILHPAQLEPRAITNFIRD